MAIHRLHLYRERSGKSKRTELFTWSNHRRWNAQLPSHRIQSGGNGRPSREPIEQQHFGRGAVVGNGGGGIEQRQFHSYGIGGERRADGYADGNSGWRDSDQRNQPVRCSAHALAEHNKCKSWDGGSGRDGNGISDADFLRYGCRDGKRRIAERHWVHSLRRKLPIDPEPGSDGDADGEVRADGGGPDKRLDDVDEQLVDGNHIDDQPERDGATGVERSHLHGRIDHRSGQ